MTIYRFNFYAIEDGNLKDGSVVTMERPFFTRRELAIIRTELAFTSEMADNKPAICCVWADEHLKFVVTMQDGRIGYVRGNAA